MTVPYENTWMRKQGLIQGGVKLAGNVVSVRTLLYLAISKLYKEIDHVSHKTDLYSIILKHSWACLVESHSERKIALRKIKGGGLSLFEPLCHSEESGEKYL